jgi:hypothetical protein
VRLSWKVRSAVEAAPVSSVAVIVPAPSALELRRTVGPHSRPVERIVPAACGPENEKRGDAVGAEQGAFTSDGRTSLYASRWRSPTPSPFGESTGSSGGGA